MVIHMWSDVMHNIHTSDPSNPSDNSSCTSQSHYIVEHFISNACWRLHDAPDELHINEIKYCMSMKNWFSQILDHFNTMTKLIINNINLFIRILPVGFFMIHSHAQQLLCPKRWLYGILINCKNFHLSRLIAFIQLFTVENCIYKKEVANKNKN